MPVYSLCPIEGMANLDGLITGILFKFSRTPVMYRSQNFYGEKQAIFFNFTKFHDYEFSREKGNPGNFRVATQSIAFG
jgi:hypothetical protein